MPKNNILLQMFDVRPVDETGDLDWKKIERIERVLNVEEKFQKHEEKERRYVAMRDLEYNPRNAEIFQLGEKLKSEEVPFFSESSYVPEINYPEPEQENYFSREEQKFEEEEKVEYDPKKLKESFHFSDLFLPARFSLNFNPRKLAFSFASLSLIIALMIGGAAYGAKGLKIKGKVLGDSQEAYSNLNSAIDSIRNQNFESSGLEFEKSYEKFEEASKNLDEMGKIVIEISRFFPFSSKLSSGKNLVEAGKHIAIAGQSLNEIIKKVSYLQNPLGEKGNNNISFLEIFKSSEKDIKIVSAELDQIQENIDKINVDDLPEDKREQFSAIKEKLPSIRQFVKNFLGNSEIFSDLLGGNGPRKYLFLFQNNQEMRATGGFIGSYGIMDISEGRIRNFFIDGIFNPDGQLQEKIVPPKPIQKISAAWSLHDSNWFPDFPTSAKKAMDFYEKTGGPTADGVITLTPTIMQELLKITGPIEMKDYDVTIDSENFIEKTQYEVEVDYDKEENKPKKILSDLAPIILDRIFNARDAKSIAGIFEAFSEGLAQKHVLFYSQNEDLQKIISEKGWSGEILDTQKDYLSVINTNINGFKTDGVIDEKIEHIAEIQNDGTIIDTVTITRHHNGGDTDYEWWNKVNADYMRVYVPLGAKLLEAEGQTRETVNPPLDYDSLGFKKDPLVQKEEGNVLIDENSGTRIYEDSGKTVFANWTYVSPKETMVLRYKYLLPFKINLNSEKTEADSYSLLVQKQSGSIGSNFISDIKFPKNYKDIWNYPENNIEKGDSSLRLETKLDVDRFIGLVFTKSNVIINN
ncbi:MAG: DUF4012 domain-containing protein [Patescibacteria group bacterium]